MLQERRQKVYKNDKAKSCACIKAGKSYTEIFIFTVRGTVLDEQLFFLPVVWLQVFLTIHCSEDKICLFVREFSVILIMDILNSKIGSVLKK